MFPSIWLWSVMLTNSSNRGNRSSLTPAVRALSFCMSLLVCLAVPFQVACAGDPQAAQTESETDSDRKPKFRTELIRGKVTWLAAALKSKFGISTVPEVAENSLALVTDDGRLLPIVENLRGRAFRMDERLRGKDMQILARRYQQQPLIQVLRVYEFDEGKRYEVDYWCDVCAIVMFETGPCACCQDDNRLRKRLVGKDDGEPSVPDDR
jgi:hypothetical protein